MNNVYLIYIFTDTTFKNSIIRQFVTIKYEMRSMDEKLNQIISLLEDNKQNSSYENKNDDLIQFEQDFPIKSYDNLLQIENKILDDKAYRINLVSTKLILE